MTFLKRALVSAVFATPLVFAAASADAAPTWWTCNDDGHLWVHWDNGGGTMSFQTNTLCGPGLREPGDAVVLTIATGRRGRLPPGSRTFLNMVERSDEMLPPAAAGVRRDGEPPHRAGRTLSITLRPEDVSPRLAAFLDERDPTWRGDRSREAPAGR